MMSSTRLYLTLALCVVGRAPARAQPPPTQEVKAPKAKHVRQVGGERGPKVEIASVAPQGARAARAAAWHVLKHNLTAPSELPPVVREELHLHARRMARLQRVRLLALQAHDQATMQRADQLLAREQARHREQLARTWPVAQPSTPKKVAPPKDDDQDDEKGERDTEDEDDPQEGQP